MKIIYYITKDGAYCEGTQNEAPFDITTSIIVEKRPSIHYTYDKKKKKWIKKEKTLSKENFINEFFEYEKEMQKQNILTILQNYEDNYKRLPKNIEEFYLYYNFNQEE